MKRVRKILSILVVACMLLGMLPVTSVFAADAPEVQLVVNSEGKNYIYANGRFIKVKPDGIYDYYTDALLISIASTDITGAVFGGSQDGNVENTKVVVTSGASPVKVFGGCFDGDVSGLAQVIVEAGGNVPTSLYGGSNTSGTVNNIYVEVNSNSGTIATLFGGNYKGTVTGNINVVLNNALIGGMGGGGSSSVEVGGNVDVKINNSTITGNLYGGGAAGSSVLGNVTVTFTGESDFATTSGKIFQPMCLKSKVLTGGGVGVSGDTNVFIPKSFLVKDVNNVIRVDKIQTNSGICIFTNDGEKVFGPDVYIDNKNVYLDGAKAVIKKSSVDNKTYVYNRSGTGKYLNTPIDGLTVYGGDKVNTVSATSIVFESGNLAAIYGGSLNATVSGNTFVNLKGGVVDSVYAGSVNTTVGGKGQIKIEAGATVTNNVYANYVDKANEAVVWVTKGFDRNKIKQGEKVRNFVDYAELYDPNITVTKEIYVKDNYVFANGIPIVIRKEDENDKNSRTYIYDSTEKTKLLATEVNGMEIFGGSYEGVVDSTNVTLKSGTINRIYGGGFYGAVTGTAKITVNGGDITEVIYGGSYDGDVGSTDVSVNGPYVAKGVNAGSRNGCVFGDTNVVLKDTVAKGLYAGTGGDGRGDGFPASDVLGNASYKIVGGYFESLYGGCKSGLIHGTSTLTLEGNVVIRKDILPLGKGDVTGGTTLNIPGNIYNMYKSKISTGTGITINPTADAVIPASPKVINQKDKVMSKDGDSGKLVFRFIDIPTPDGALTGRPGEAYYITFPNGKNMLVDAGGDTDWSQKIITDFLDEMKVTRLDYVVASHFHSDHIGRMANILNKYEIGTLYKTGYDVPLTGGYYTSLKTWMDKIDKVTKEKVNSSTNLWRGDKLTIDGVEIEVLNPVYDTKEIARMAGGGLGDEDYNSNSIVLKLKYGENSALLTGDIYEGAEKELMEFYKGTDTLKADLIKTPHHGDTTSNGPEFVKAVSAKTAVLTHISDTPIVNNRYKAFGADTYVTGVDGFIKVAFDGVNPGVVTPEKYIAKPENITIAGDNILFVDNTTNTVVNYTYSAYDQYGKAISLDQTKLTRSLTDDNGNLVNDSALTFVDDTLTVTGRPQVDYIVVNYTYGEIKATKRIEFKPVDYSNYTVTVEGANELNVLPVVGATATYSAVVKNADDQVITEVPVDLKLNAYDGLVASFADNTLKVSRDSVEGTLKVSAMYKGTTDIVAEKSVAIKISAQVATSLVLTGKTGNIFVDSTTESVESYTYSVIDQFGNSITDIAVTKTLTDDNGNIINDSAITFVNDTLTVKGVPQVNYINVNYVYGDLKETKRIEFQPVPTSEYTVTIDGSDKLTASLLGDLTAEYTATVKNKNGQIVENLPVELTLVSNEGLDVSFADNKLTVLEGTKAGTLKLQAIYAGTTTVAAEKAISIAAVPTLTVNPSEVNVRYNNPTFTLKLTSDSYTNDIIADLVSGKLVSTMNSTVTMDNMKEGVKLTLALDKTTGEFSVEKTIDGVESDKLNGYDKGTYSVYVEFPELNVKGTFTITIKDKEKDNNKTGPVVVAPTPTPTPKPTTGTTTPTPTPTTKPESTTKPDKETKPESKFEDLKEHWAGSYIGKLVEKGVIKGKGENKFDPEGKMTRAEFATVIVRALNLPEGKDVSFSDVKNDEWYAKNINAAFNAGLIGGNGDGSFSPDDFINREEMVVIISRMYTYAKGDDAKSVSGEIFTDESEISDWAKSDLAKIYSLGLISGSDGKFAPKADMTRAEGATIICKLLEKLGAIK